ncbi:unnamed protein product [marine sediment metagenome]|uniref:Uncharacterized protein n=1 Tax=marine sediment metagenome TaxID=412755 RepID=X1NPM5_9ZZZZ
MFEIDTSEIRERRFYFYNSKHQNYQSGFLTHLDEFIINGSVFDKASWRTGLTYHSPKGSYHTEKIDFATKEAHPFLLRGWSRNKKSKKGYTYNWALGSSSSVFITLPKNEPVTLTANIQSARFNEPQVITIKVEGAVIGHWELSTPWNLAEHNIVIGPNKHRADVSVVEFIFSQHLSPEKHRLAVIFESITLKPGVN